MTRDEGVARIKEQLAFRQTLDSTIVTNMQFVQTVLESAPTKPWFLVTDYAPLVTVANQEYVALPDDFLQEVEESHLWYRAADYPTTKDTKLIKDDYDDLKELYKDYDPGTPEAYAIMGDRFYFFPLPDDVYSIIGRYFGKATVLTSNVENGWLKWAPMLFLGTTLKVIATGPLRDQVAAGVANEWITLGGELLRKQNEARLSASREDQIGGKHW